MSSAIAARGLKPLCAARAQACACSWRARQDRGVVGRAAARAPRPAAGWHWAASQRLHERPHRPPANRAGSGGHVAAAAAAAASSSSEQHGQTPINAPPVVLGVVESLQLYLRRFSGLWQKFLPMLSLFFCLSFINTILDSLKDTLVITAAGGGAHVIPYLTVYAVLPISFMFLVAYSHASRHLSRAGLFNTIVAAFMVFFGAFTLLLYPNAELLHPHAMADSLSSWLPAGLAGGVGMVRNWTFTLFFCMAELWGDVCMGLLFWGLANDTTSLAEAPVLYPLFGLGANVAQALAGLVLKATSSSYTSSQEFGSCLNTSMAIVVGMAVAVVVIHNKISRDAAAAAAATAAAARVGLSPAASWSGEGGEEVDGEQAAAWQERVASHGAASTSGRSSSSSSSNGRSRSSSSSGWTAEEEHHYHHHLGDPRHSHSPSSSSSSSSPSSSSSERGRTPQGGRSSSIDQAGTSLQPYGVDAGDDSRSASQQQQRQQQEEKQRQQQEERQRQRAKQQAAAAEHKQQQEKHQRRQQVAEHTLRESFHVLASSMEIRCLAVMSLAQGLTTNLMEFAWKSHMRLLYPSPQDFTAFLGDVATWTGVVTGGLMLATPLLFDRLGWRGVASATPQILLWGGCVFFAACILYQHLFGAAAATAGAAAGGVVGGVLLQGLVMTGALLYVFSKGAKFSLFKPAEEMVYITLDEEGRTRGKAAIDVVGAQTGKSGGSLLQQALLLISAGSLTGILPVMFGVFFMMLKAWLQSVRDLSSVRYYTYHSMDEESDGSDAEAAPRDQQQQQGGEMPLPAASASVSAAAADGSAGPNNGASRRPQPGRQQAGDHSSSSSLGGSNGASNGQLQQQQQHHGVTPGGTTTVRVATTAANGAAQHAAAVAAAGSSAATAASNGSGAAPTVPSSSNVDAAPAS